MSSSACVDTMRPGYLLNQYPERSDLNLDSAERVIRRLKRHRSTNKVKRDCMPVGRQVAKLVSELETEISAKRVGTLRSDLIVKGWSREVLTEALTVVGARVRECFGFDLHPEQYAGAWVLLHGNLAEMATGEGKTITAAVAATVAALSGAAVHVVTTNDYLVERDAQSMQRLFEAFQLKTGYVTQSMDDDERRNAYACEVCYVSNKVLVFDYLRDRQNLGSHPSSLRAQIQSLREGKKRRPLLRGLSFAIVDEADSALIDDAITPLILSHVVDAPKSLSQSLTAISLATRLNRKNDFDVNTSTRTVSLSDGGRQRLDDFAMGLEGAWINSRFREELVRQALACLHIYELDVDYLVRDGEVVLIDQSTGRLMPDRKLQNGLHQLIETKERCELSGDTHTVASLSFQNFFTRYQHLCGMTGTAKEASSELNVSYDLGVVEIPTHFPCSRLFEGVQFASSGAEYDRFMVEAVLHRLNSGQSVLVGTSSLNHSEEISELFTRQGIDHQVLNARQDREEAHVIAQAGQVGVVTIATNMAGRGTDIPLSDDVRKTGGLHVIVGQLNLSSRIDRQLIGRCSRQGDPGSYEYIIAPDDNVVSNFISTPIVGGLVRMISRVPAGSRLLLRRAKKIQRKIETRQRNLRKQVAESDAHMRKSLAFTGYKE